MRMVEDTIEAAKKHAEEIALKEDVFEIYRAIERHGGTFSVFSIDGALRWSISITHIGFFCGAPNGMADNVRKALHELDHQHHSGDKC